MARETIQQITDVLVEAIRQSEEYTSFQTLKASVMEDETTKVLLKEYHSMQTTLQMAALAGKEADGETVQKFSKLSSLLHMHEDAAQYLLAQMRLQKLTGEIFQQIAQATGLDLPGM